MVFYGLYFRGRQAREQIEVFKRNLIVFVNLGVTTNYIVFCPLDGAIDVFKNAIGAYRLNDASLRKTCGGFTVVRDRERKTLIFSS